LFLRSFTWGNVLQLEQVSRLVLADLARRTPQLPGKDAVAFMDIDSTQKRVYGHKKHGAAFGHTKTQGKSLLVRGQNVLAATISAPVAAPVIAATRLRGGNAASSRGAASFAAVRSPPPAPPGVPGSWSCGRTRRSTPRPSPGKSARRSNPAQPSDPGPGHGKHCGGGVSAT
jgi:hypothetical protein